jgi:hypothetical protein
MNMLFGDTDLTVRCAFCGKPLPTLNGELQRWRAPSGQLFCNEFCADDADEARFYRRSSVAASPVQEAGKTP